MRENIYPHLKFLLALTVNSFVEMGLPSSQNIDDALAVIGFSEKEVGVLNFLLNTPSAPASTIALRTKMKRSSCYLILDTLIHKGFVVKYNKNGVLFYTLNERYPFKFERDIHAEVSKRIEKAFLKAKNGMDAIDFDEILDIAVQTVADRLDELVGIFLIENDDLVFRQAHLKTYGGNIFNYVGQKLFGLKTSVGKASNFVAKTAKTGETFFGPKLKDFVCPMVGPKIADGIQAIPRFKYVYCCPIKTQKRIYGTGMISFDSEDAFRSKKTEFEQIMNRAAECIELKITMRQFEQRTFNQDDLDIIKHSMKMLPVEMIAKEDDEFAPVKLFELKKLRLLS